MDGLTLYSEEELRTLKAAAAILGRRSYGPGPFGDNLLLEGHHHLQNRGTAYQYLKAHVAAQDFTYEDPCPNCGAIPGIDPGCLQAPKCHPAYRGL